MLEEQTTLGRFHYDYQGLRVEKSGADGVLRYSYDGDSVLTQSDTGGTTVAKYEYGADRLLSLNSAGEGRRYYHHDALWSVVALSDGAGAAGAAYRYDVWGRYRETTGQSGNPFGFTGHERDGETGLYYFKARFYDPEVGRFLSRDSYLGEGETPPSLHRYLYAYANPTAYIDLTGHAALLASGQEFDALGEQLYAEGNVVGAAAVAIGSAFYKTGTGFFTAGLFDEANQAITDNDTYGGAARQFGSSVVKTAKEVAVEYAEEGVVGAGATVASKAACGRWRQACSTIVDFGKKIGDKLNSDIKLPSKSGAKPKETVEDAGGPSTREVPVETTAGRSGGRSESGGGVPDRTPLTYDISKWGEYGLPSDGNFVRTITREQYLDLKAGREFNFGGKPVEGYPNGMGFIGSAEEVRGIETAAGYKDALQLSREPKFVMEFQLRDPSGLQNVLSAPYAEFVPGGRTGAGFLEWNYPGITTKDIINPTVRALK